MILLGYCDFFKVSDVYNRQQIGENTSLGYVYNFAHLFSSRTVSYLLSLFSFISCICSMTMNQYLDKAMEYELIHDISSKMYLSDENTYYIVTFS